MVKVWGRKKEKDELARLPSAPRTRQDAWHTVSSQEVRRGRREGESREKLTCGISARKTASMKVPVTWLLLLRCLLMECFPFWVNLSILISSRTVKRTRWGLDNLMCSWNFCLMGREARNNLLVIVWLVYNILEVLSQKNITLNVRIKIDYINEINLLLKVKDFQMEWKTKPNCMMYTKCRPHLPGRWRREDSYSYSFCWIQWK